jgi:hypothetical protein
MRVGRTAAQRGLIDWRDVVKRSLMALLVALPLMVPALARAQDTSTQGGADQANQGDVQTRFYDFNDMLIDGEFMRPEGMFTRARDRARFERLLDLRREFIDQIEESAKEEALQ